MLALSSDSNGLGEYNLHISLLRLGLYSKILTSRYPRNV